ncbi:MAG: sensor histidine kinase [Spirochaetales bacterium]|nr:sensor histidine kinase [Spirochaetales bacterium]
MKRPLTNLSIEQSILLATLSIVMIVLFISSTVYYSVFSRKTDSLVQSQSREINKQIVLNYESYINSVIETANYIQFASLNRDVSRSDRELEDVYFYNSEIKKDVVAIYLFDEEGNKLLGNELNLIRLFDITRESWFRNALDEPSIFHFSAPHNQSVSRAEIDQVISVTRSVEYTWEGMKKNGVILIELNFRVLTDLAGKTNLGEGGHIMILNDADSLIYYSGSWDDEGFERSLSLAEENYLGGFRTRINNREMFLNINTLAHTRWRIVTVSNVNEIAQARQQLLMIIFFIFLFSFIVTIVVSLMISRRISSPLNQLKKAMLKIERGDFTTRVMVTSGQKEVIRLSRSFNSMLEEIHSLMDKVVNEQREKRKTELKALQNQINPHFLYNTLDSIVWLAENHRSDDVVTTVIALARFFRISISKGQQFITVRDEISHIKNYLTIQKIRYVDKFEYSFEIDPAINDQKVMKLILQPIVENAIYHGVGDDDVEKITIRAGREKDLLIFEVENTGYGITEERIAEIYEILKGNHSITSVGMRNVYLRLKLFYGEEADIEIRSVLDEKTNIKLIIPIKKEGEKNT